MTSTLPAPPHPRSLLTLRGYNPDEEPSYPQTEWTLRQLRVRAGLSIRDLERACGVSRGALSMIERGQLVATVAQADAVAVALGLREGALSSQVTLMLKAAA